MFIIQEYDIDNRSTALVACFNNIEELPDMINNIHNAVQEIDGDLYGPLSEVINIGIIHEDYIFDLDTESYNYAYVVREMPVPFMSITAHLRIHCVYAITFDPQF